MKIEGWEEEVLLYPRLREKIKESEILKTKAIQILHEIRAKESPTTMSGMTAFVKFLASKLYNKINFEENGLDILALLETNNLIFVPNHQSYADFVALNYSFHLKYKRPLFVAGGINLNFFPLGDIFRKCGCFFIRRSFNSDVLYKITLEAYLYYLLLNGKPIEFFFEGGRSRTGKLLPPRYGLYQMLIEAHKAIPEEKRKPLLFVPVSIAHEYLPEQRSLARELRGGRKTQESTKQLYKIFRIFTYHMGSIHIRLSPPIEAPEIIGDLRESTQKLAFNCFFQVAKNMLVTPSNLCTLILLDEPTGALKWEEIREKALKIIAYCKHYNIPLTENLQNDKMEVELRRSLSMFVGNRRIEVVGDAEKGRCYYAIKDQFRLELLYFKNAVVHHFIIPWIIGQVWVKVFRGQISSVEDLKTYFLKSRDQLKHEFYLPTVKEFFRATLDHISTLSGRRVETLEQCLEISNERKVMFTIISGIGVFNRSLTYIAEGYYIAALTVKELSLVNNGEFDTNTFTTKAREIFELELDRAMVIKFQESFSLPLLKNGLKYFTGIEILSAKGDRYSVISGEKLDQLIADYKDDIESAQMINIRDRGDGKEIWR